MRYEDIFRDKRIIDRADLIAIRIERTDEYLIKKCRGGRFVTGGKLKSEYVVEALSSFKRPIILSDSYVEMEGLR